MVYESSGDAVLLGIVGAARVLPYVLLSIPAGIVADRFERRLVLLVTDVARGILMLLMAVVVANHGPLALIVALAVAATCFSSFFGPTIGAYLPSLVRDERELGPANSAWSTLDNLAFVIGPAIGGLLIAFSGLTLAFLLNAISFAFVAAVLWRLPAERRASEPSSKETATEPSGEPADQPATAPPALRPLAVPLVGLAIADVVVGFVFGGLSVLTVVLAVDHLRAGEAATGYLNAAVGVGGIIGALASGAFVVRPGLRAPLVLGSLGMAVGVAGLGLTTALGPALVVMALASAGSLLTEVVSTTIFQRIVPDVIRGRALGTIATVSTLAYSAGALALPVMSGVLGVTPVLVASGVLLVIGVALAALVVGPRADQAATTEIQGVARRVAGLPIFAGVPASRLIAAFTRAREMDIAAGQRVIRQGDRADRFYVILEGSFEVVRAEAPGAQPVHLRTMGRDEVFGEIGLLTGAPRTATVTAESDGRLLALDAANFLELVASGTELGPRLLALHRGAVAGGVASPAGTGN